MIGSLTRLVTARSFVAAVFVLAHIWLAWAGVKAAGFPMGDINFAYLPWVSEMNATGQLLGITKPWVYPYPDLVFMFLPQWLPNGDYQMSWLTMQGVLDLVALGVLLYWPVEYRKERVQAAWFWVLGLLLLGPVAISRLDSISISFAVIGAAAVLNARPALASGILALATWVKVWPVALLATLYVRFKSWRAVLLAGGLTAVLLAIWGIILGGFQNTFSFVLQQTHRGIQIESLWATPWLWGKINGLEGWGLYYSHRLQTFQVKGPFVTELAAMLGPVMYLALAITVVLGLLAVRSVAAEDFAARGQAYAWTVLTAVLDLIVFNKVGSPQYYGWLIVPAILGIALRVKDWGIVAAWLVVILGLTGLVYPLNYGDILGSGAFGTAILAGRNLAALALLVLTNWRLTELVLKQKRTSLPTAK